MAIGFKYISPYEPLPHSKRLFRLRDRSMRGRVRRKNAALRLKHNPPGFYTKNMNKPKRRFHPFWHQVKHSIGNLYILKLFKP